MRATRKDKGQRRTQWVTLTCEHCGTQFERRLSETKQRSFCSRECFHKSGASKLGGRPKTFTAGIHENAQTETLEAAAKYGNPDGWSTIKNHITYHWPSHPYSKNGKITEQRIVAYEHMGDVLNGHHISHLDGNPRNNNWANLLILDPGIATPANNGIMLWQGFFQWATQHSPETVAQYLEAAAN